MNKVLMIFASMLALALLLGQVFFPNFPLLWVASQGTGFVLIRAAIVVTLTVLLFRGGFSSPLYKPLLLSGAGGLLSLSTALLVSDNLSLADGVIFIEAAIVLAIEALESPSRGVPLTIAPIVGRLRVGNDFVKIGAFSKKFYR